jgi:hypothetical protein
MKDRYNTTICSGALLTTGQFINSSKSVGTSFTSELCVRRMAFERVLFRIPLSADVLST